MTLGELRAEVLAALEATLGPVFGTAIVHPYIPAELATPAVWIDSPIELVTIDAAEVLASVNVIVVVDGAEPAQITMLDELEGAVWLALESVGTAGEARALELNVGGPMLHAVRVVCDIQVAARTLCTPELVTVP